MSSLDSNRIVDAAKYLSIAIIVIQLLFNATLHAFQAYKVKGALKTYLLFDFLSVFAISTSLFFEVKDIKKNLDKVRSHYEFRTFNSSIDMDDSAFNVFGAVVDITQLFVNLRKGFLVLIINDAYVMLCQPFHFKEYLEGKTMIKRYLILIGFWLFFHALHISSMVTNLVYFLTSNYYVEKIYLSSHHLGFQSTKLVLVFVYNCMLLIIGSIRCIIMRSSLQEMDQNEFAKNIHCNSLYKMSVVLCGLIATSMVRDVVIFFDQLGKMTMARSMYFLLGKATYDTFFGIIVMILLVIFFPSLRPRLIIRH